LDLDVGRDGKVWAIKKDLSMWWREGITTGSDGKFGTKFVSGGNAG
jgi:hypothetical protein